MKARYLLFSSVLGLGLALFLSSLLSGSPAPAAAASAAGKSGGSEGPAYRLPRAPGNVITVCPGSGCDYTNVQDAVDAASDGDTIKIAAGTYTGVQHRRAPQGYIGAITISQVVYIDKSVTIRGGYTTTTSFTDPPDPVAHPTTLDAQGQGRVVFIAAQCSGQAANPTLEGLRITGGNDIGLGGFPVYWGSVNSGGGLYLFKSDATLQDNIIDANTSYGVGGGLFLWSSGATLSENTIAANSARHEGGGLYLSGSGDAVLSGNTISHNTAEVYGAGLYLSGSPATLSANVISANTTNRGRGGGLYLRYSDAALSDNIVSANVANEGSGGGLYLEYSDATLSRNAISSNTATYGGGGLHLWVSDATLDSNAISANTGGYGGGLCLTGGSDATLANNVVADNQARYAGSGLYIAGSPHLLHTTIARNSGGDGSGIYVVNMSDEYSTVALTNTILVGHAVGITITTGNTAILEATLWGQGKWANATDWGGPGTVITGVHNYWTAPAFIAPNLGDYHIGSTSGARDTGVGAGVNHDVDGQMRPMDWGHDLGADEYPGVGLGILIQPSATFVNLGQPLTYTILVTSAGSGNATGVILTDTLDGWQRPTAVTASAGTCSTIGESWGGTVTCSLGTLVPDETVSITLAAQISRSITLRQAIANTVEVGANETTNSARATKSIHDCHVRINDAPAEYTIVQAAVDAASTGDLIKVAGVCLGVNERQGLRQQVYVDKSLTIRGGYTTTNWSTSDSNAHATTLDALGQGRVLYIAGDPSKCPGQAISATIEGLGITGGDVTDPDDEGYNRGGGLYVINATVTISSNRIYSNHAKYGGGLYLDASSTMFNNNKVASNTATVIRGGGGLYLDDSTATLSANTISSNAGGGLYSHKSDIVLNGNTIATNTAREGGGLCLLYGTATLSGNLLISNTAYSDGGGLYLLGSGDAVLSGNTVSHNTAEAYGAGLYLSGSDVTLSANVISANTTNEGGGGGLCLISSDSDVTLSDNIVSANAAGDIGGGLLLASNDVTLSGNTVTSNTADCGGGLYLSGSDDATLNGNTIISNTAAVGGGLYLYWSNARLINNIVADNQAHTAGSGLYIERSAPRVLHTTIARNGSADGGDGSGIYVTGYQRPSYYFASAVTLTNTILVSHTVGITVAAGNTATLQSTLWDGNTIDWSGEGTVNHEGDHTGPPAFVNPDAGDYHVALISAAVDRGVDAGVQTDIDGEPRPQGFAPDIGADETGLAVVKRAHPETVRVDERLTYTIHITNTTSDVDLHATVTDTLPAPLAPVETAGGTLALPGGTAVLPDGGVAITWTALITAPGGAWLGTIVATMEEDHEEPLTNVVTVMTEQGVPGVAIAIINAPKLYLPSLMRSG